jgi:hypothetical protein
MAEFVGKVRPEWALGDGYYYKHSVIRCDGRKDGVWVSVRGAVVLVRRKADRTARECTISLAGCVQDWQRPTCADAD